MSRRSERLRKRQSVPKQSNLRNEIQPEDINSPDQSIQAVCDGMTEQEAQGQQGRVTQSLISTGADTPPSSTKPTTEIREADQGSIQSQVTLHLQPYSFGPTRPLELLLQGFETTPVALVGVPVPLNNEKLPQEPSPGPAQSSVAGPPKGYSYCGGHKDPGHCSKCSGISRCYHVPDKFCGACSPSKPSTKAHQFVGEGSEK